MKMGFSDLKRTRSAVDKFTKERIYVRTLALSDLEACVALEEAAFIPSERCSRETVYYLFLCPPLYALLTSNYSFHIALKSVQSYVLAFLPSAETKNIFSAMPSQPKPSRHL